MKKLTVAALCLLALPLIAAEPQPVAIHSRHVLDVRNGSASDAKDIASVEN